MASTARRTLKTTVTLNDGVVMPAFGMGSGGSFGDDGKMVLGVTQQSIQYALGVGYRMIDTSEMYTGAEELIGRALAGISNIKREELFIVNKVVVHDKEAVVKACHDGLNKLGVSYIDLYLIHVPFGGKIVEAFDTLLELKDKGLVRSVGVANFGIQHLEGLAAAGRPSPSVNQIELHPWQQKDDIVKYCREHDITVIAYSPLTKAQKLNYPELIEVAERYKKSPGQILLRWSLQKDYIPICMSKSRDHIKENSDVFEFELSEKDMETMNSFKQEPLQRPNTWNPTESPWEG